MMSDVPCVACRPAWRYRVAVLASTTVGLAAILASGLLRAVAPAAASGDPVATFAPRLVYNASDSVPRGFYRSEEHTSELQSLMRISYAVFCLKKKKQTKNN